MAGVGFNNYLNNIKELSGQLWREIKSTIAEYKSTVVWISAKSQNFSPACMVAKFAKEIQRANHYVCGGYNPSMVGTDILNCSDFDVGVKGEGENNIIEARKKFDSIRDIVYRKNGQIVETAPGEFIIDLDSLCFPHGSASEALKDYSQYTL